MPGNETLFGTLGTDVQHLPGREFVERDTCLAEKPGLARVSALLNEYAADSNVASIFASKDRKFVVNLLFVVSPNLDTPDTVGLWHGLPDFHCCPLSGCLRNLQ